MDQVLELDGVNNILSSFAGPPLRLVSKAARDATGSSVSRDLAIAIVLREGFIDGIAVRAANRRLHNAFGCYDHEKLLHGDDEEINRKFSGFGSHSGRELFVGKLLTQLIQNSSRAPESFCQLLKTPSYRYTLNRCFAAGVSPWSYVADRRNNTNTCSFVQAFLDVASPR